MTKETPLAHRQHNHSQCIKSALNQAQEICAARGVRLTPLRLQVLEFIWQSHAALGAYDLLDMLAAESQKRVAPPTVYRALDFLLEQGLIHRINSLNAFIGCPHPDTHHHNHFLICRGCGSICECEPQALTPAIATTADQMGFKVEQESVEISGLCSDCCKRVN